MTGLEYTNRLIEDISTTIEGRNKVADPFSQVKQLGLSGQHSLEDFVAALNVWEADAHLDIVSQFINFNERIVNHDKGDKVNIEVFQHDITENRDSIGHLFQQLLDNKELVDLQTKTPIGDLLVEQLDYIHESVCKGI